MITRAKPVDGGYLVSGLKTGSPIRQSLMSLLSGRKSDAHDGKIKGFLLEKGMKGLNARRSRGKCPCAPPSPA